MKLQHNITVGLGARSYPIFIGNGLVPEIGTELKTFVGQRMIIVSDENVAALHLPAVEAMCNALCPQVESIMLPAGEATKSMQHFETLTNQILAFGPERGDMLVALGGGVIGDITGFAASAVLRGMPFIQIPTSLLAMVDSSVGGKTGINTPYGKNLLGAFYQPKAVIIDTDFLDTLPKREWQAGYAEVVKYGLINDADFFTELESATDPYADNANNIAVSCQAKADIVAADEHEKGQRALLNLGHTFGHALEAEMGYDGRLLHGEAVSIGMVMAFGFAAAQGMCNAEDAARVAAHLQQAGLPISLQDLLAHDWQPDRLLAHMQRDKKVESGQLTFILPRAIGACEVVKGVQAEDVLRYLKAYCHSEA